MTALLPRHVCACDRVCVTNMASPDRGDGGSPRAHEEGRERRRPRVLDSERWHCREREDDWQERRCERERRPLHREREEERRGRGERRLGDERRRSPRRHSPRRHSPRRPSPSLSPSPQRHRERQLRHKQQADAQWNRAKKFWDGFQWVDATAARVASQSHNQISPHAISVSQATRRDRRVFVGNLPCGVGLTEKQITEFLTSLMRDRGLVDVGDEPIVSLWVHPERKYAFAELDTIEHANAILTVSSATLLSHTIRIKRPDYRHESGLMVAVGADAAAGHSIASVPGSIASVPGSAIGYLGAVGASVAAAALPAASAVAACARADSAAAASVSGSAGVAAPAYDAACNGSCALRCSNMACPEDMASEHERAALKEEVGDECARFGEVESIKLPTSDNADCHLYVRFATPAGASAALEALQGRKFDGREVQVALCPIERFEALVDGA